MIAPVRVRPARAMRGASTCAQRACPLVDRALALALTLVALATPACATAQELHGVVLQQDSTTPAAGAIVVMLDSASDKVVARVVAGARGFFSLSAPTPRYVRLSVLRLGQRPTDAGGFSLAAGSAREVRLVLSNDPIAAAAFEVKAESKCRLRRDASATLQQLFDEARKTLMSSASSVSGTTNTATFSRYTRQDDKRGKPMQPERRTTSTGPTTRPFRSIDADRLVRDGFVTRDAATDTSTYWAPDAEVLFDEQFLERHCLQLATGKDNRTGQLGIAFRPVNRPRDIVDVTGTIWMDSASRELRSVEYAYDGLARDLANAGAGGEVQFTHTSDGLWFVHEWTIRMPRATLKKKDGPSLPGTAIEMAVTLDGLNIAGGTVESVRSNGDLVYERGASAVNARVAASPQIAATNSATNSATNTVTSSVTSPVTSAPSDRVSPAAGRQADTIAVTTKCGDKTTASFSALLLGRVVNVERIGVSGANVLVEWIDEPRSAGMRREVYQMQATSIADGVYEFCGLPVARALSVTATMGNRQSLTNRLQIAKDARRAELDLVLQASPPY